VTDKPNLIAEILRKNKGQANQATSKGELCSLINKIREITATDEYAMEFEPGAIDEEIRQFEKNNDISLPELVKEWLRFTDGCCLFNTTVQLYGISHKPYIDINPSAIEGDYIEIGAFRFGDPICIVSNSQAIFQYGESVIEYADFKKFLETVIEMGVRP
jgi:hypothetical protein